MTESRILRNSRSVFAHTVAIAILIGILTAGLWPFHAPLNQVSWLGAGPGLRFGQYASIVSSQPFPLASPPVEHSLEILIEAGNPWDNNNTFLTFYRPQSPVRFALRQFQRNIAVQLEVRTAHSYRSSRIFLSDAFLPSRALLITIVAGAKATSGYLDGALVQNAPHFLLDSDAFAGRLLIGDSPFRSDSWAGRLLGVAVYNQALTSAEVLRHYQDWTKRGSPERGTGKGVPPRSISSTRSRATPPTATFRVHRIYSFLGAMPSSINTFWSPSGRSSNQVQAFGKTSSSISADSFLSALSFALTCLPTVKAAASHCSPSVSDSWSA